jgi:hypothetical protein
MTVTWIAKIVQKNEKHMNVKHAYQLHIFILSGENIIQQKYQTSNCQQKIQTNYYVWIYIYKQTTWLKLNHDLGDVLLLLLLLMGEMDQIRARSDFFLAGLQRNMLPNETIS